MLLISSIAHASEWKTRYNPFTSKHDFVRGDDPVFSGDVSVQGDVSANGDMTANAFFGDGSQLSGIAASPGGSDTQIQYNDGGSFAGAPTVVFAKATGNFTVGTDLLDIEDDHNQVGIGTNTPSERLHIYDTGAVTKFKAQSTGNYCFWKFQNNHYSWDLRVDGGNQADDEFSIMNGTTVVDALIVSTNNNVTIGPVAGTERLNVSGNAKIDGDITGSGNLTVTDIVYTEMLQQRGTWHAYGGFQDLTVSTTINTVNVWEHITNATNDQWTGLEADGLTLNNDVMTFENDGDYFGHVSISLSGLNGKDFQIRLYNITQAAQMGYVIGVSTTSVNNFVNISLPLYIEANAGDQMRMEVRCTTDASDPTLRSAVFYISYLHD